MKGGGAFAAKGAGSHTHARTHMRAHTLSEWLFRALSRAASSSKSRVNTHIHTHTHTLPVPMDFEPFGLVLTTCSFLISEAFEASSDSMLSLMAFSSFCGRVKKEGKGGHEREGGLRSADYM